MDMENQASKKKLERHRGESEGNVSHHARGEQVAGGDRRNVKAPKDALFAKHHNRGAQSPETAHHVERQNRTEKIGGTGRHAFAEKAQDRKSTRLNSSHTVISYAV